MDEYKLIKIHGYGEQKEAFVKVDLEDYEFLNQWSWKLSSPKGYARRTIRAKGRKSTTLYMHQLIMDSHGSKMDVDHINGDHLDNRKSNLRVCSHSDNLVNRHVSNGACGEVGVCRHYDKYQARIVRDNKRIYLGRFDSVEEAAQVIREHDKEYGHFRYNLSV